MTDPAPTTADASPPGEAATFIDAARLGERLGRYQLVLPLAQGGMGLVFAARLVGSHGVERLVAIKTLRPITSASDRAALLREAKLTARLHHRNVVATLDIGEVDDVPYVVMELVDGVALSRLRAELSKRGEQLAPELAAWIVMQAANGLHAAHELPDAEGRPLDLVHRDVSPQNILLSTQGEVKIADFGIAKYVGREESTATGMIKGKFGYMSPEQASSGDLDRRSDVFALGIVLWEALTGERLFSMETPARTLLRVLEHRPAPPSSVRPEVGEDLSAIASRCLAKDPADRYPTAAALADALRAALRTRASHVDEGDLAAAVKRLFGDERARMMERIRTEPPIAEGTTVTSVEAPDAASALVAVSVSTGERDRARGAARRGLVVAALGIVVAGGGAVWWAMRAPSAPTAATASAVTSIAPIAASAPASAAPLPVVEATPAASSSAPVAAPPARASAARTTPRAPIAPPPSKPAPRASASASAKPAAQAPQPAPKPSTPAGQPFDSL